jgi:Ca2+-binding EF-hand superfamily protein
MAGPHGKTRSLDRQITTQDIDCLREAFALFDVNRKDEITTQELGKVRLKHLGITM